MTRPMGRRRRDEAMMRLIILRIRPDMTAGVPKFGVAKVATSPLSRLMIYRVKLTSDGAKAHECGIMAGIIAALRPTGVE
jgi:hypothetical protein